MSGTIDAMPIIGMRRAFYDHINSFCNAPVSPDERLFSLTDSCIKLTSYTDITIVDKTEEILL